MLNGLRKETVVILFLKINTGKMVIDEVLWMLGSLVEKISLIGTRKTIALHLRWYQHELF